MTPFALALAAPDHAQDGGELLLDDWFDDLGAATVLREIVDLLMVLRLALQVADVLQLWWGCYVN